MSLKKFLKVCDYKITDGSEFLWSCFGKNAYALDSYKEDVEGYSFTVVFNKKTQEVFELQAHDYIKNIGYRYINPSYEKKYKSEAKKRGVSYKEATDTYEYIDVNKDVWYKKAKKIYKKND